MEFFDWMNIPQFFMEYFLQANSPAEYINMQRMGLLISIAVAGGLYLICLIFGGIGLFTIAKREGYKRPWLGFFPFLNTWYAGKIAGEANFFGQKMKRAGLYATLVEVLYVALETFLVVISFLLARPEYYDSAVNEEGYTTIKLMPAYLPKGLAWAADASLYCEIIAYLLWFVVLVFFCVMYTAFYRKYYARSPFLMLFLSVILPARGFTIFAVRNNRAVDYNEYMRRKMEEYARRNNPYGPYGGGPYNGSYNNGPYNNGPYNNGPYNGQAGNGQGSAGDPFSDFGSPSGGNNGGGSAGGNDPTPPDDNPFSDF